MRAFLSAAILLLLPVSSLADREIFIPTGTKVSYRSARLEYLVQGPKGRRWDTFAAFGVTKEIDAEFQLEKANGKDALATFSFSFTPISPITDTLPGISLGVRDVLDRTNEGRLYYLATTFRVGTEGEQHADYLDVNLGVGHGRSTRPFVGVVLPLSSRLQLLAEHDGRNPTAGVEIRPFEGLGIRLVARQHETFLAIRLTTRF